MGELERILEADGSLDDTAAEAEPVEAEAEAETGESATKGYDVDTSRPEYDPDADEESEDDAESEEDDEDSDEEGEETGEEDAEEDEKVLGDPNSLKITGEDGKEVDVPREDLEKAYKTAKQVARFQSEAAATLQKAEQKETEIRTVIQRLTQEPAQTLEEIFSGVTGSATEGRAALVEMATNILAAHIDEEQNPQKREQRLIKQERKQLDQEKKQQENQRAEAEQEAITTQLHDEAMEAIEGAGFVTYDDDPQTFQEIYTKIMDLRYTSIQAGNPLTAADAALQVKEARAKSLAQLLKSTPAKELVEKFPEHAKQIEKIRVASAKAKKRGAKRPRRSASQAAAKENGGEKKYAHTRDFLESLRNQA